MKLIFIFLMIFELLEAKRNTLFIYKQPLMRFNQNYLNVSCDFSVFDNKTNTKMNPVEYLPEFKVWILKDLNKVMATMKITEDRSGKVMMDQKISLCSTMRFAGLFLGAIISDFKEAVQFTFECPYKKGSILKINQFEFKNIFFTQLASSYTERTNTVRILEGKSSTLIFSLSIYYMKIEIDGEKN